MFIRVDFSDPTDAERVADRIVRLMRGFVAGFVVSIHDDLKDIAGRRPDIKDHHAIDHPYPGLVKTALDEMFNAPTSGKPCPCCGDVVRVK